VEPESLRNGETPDMTDRLRLGVSGIRLVGRHGVYPEEREHGNRFLVDVEWECDSLHAAVSDELGDTIDYQEVTHLIRKINDRRSFHLIESFADAIAIGILERYPSVTKVVARVSKLAPPGLGDVDCATADVRRIRQ